MKNICKQFCYGGLNTNIGLVAKLRENDNEVQAMIKTSGSPKTAVHKVIKKDLGYTCPLGCTTLVCEKKLADQETKMQHLVDHGVPVGKICTFAYRA